jgi:hypothetical protein
MAPAAAIVTVTVNGQQYNVEALPSNKLTQLQQTSPGLLEGQPWVVQPWWDSERVALDFSAAVGAGLGFPNSGNARGPYFAFSGPQGWNAAAWFGGSFGARSFKLNTGAQVVFATATAVAEEPTPVPLESDGWAILISTTALFFGSRGKVKAIKKQQEKED